MNYSVIDVARTEDLNMQLTMSMQQYRNLRYVLMHVRDYTENGMHTTDLAIALLRDLDGWSDD